MSYQNRMKKPNAHLNPPHWVKEQKAKDIEWVEKYFGKTAYKAPYLKKRYSETINPHSGKYHGWSDAFYKERGLKKRHRQASRQLIAFQLFDMAIEAQDQIDEEDELIWEEYLMRVQEEDMEMERQFQLQMEEERDSLFYDNIYKYDDPYYHPYFYD